MTELMNQAPTLGDVVKIAAGEKLWEVTKTEDGMARLWPVGPADMRQPSWIDADVLRVVTTVSERLNAARLLFAVYGEADSSVDGRTLAEEIEYLETLIKRAAK